MDHKLIRDVSPTDSQRNVFRKELADCIILTKNNTLYLQMRPRNPEEIGKISLFGGHIEQGETPLKAVMREVKEETGGEPQEKDLIFIGAVTEEWTNYADIVHVYFWHDKDGTITGCYEDDPIEFKNVGQALLNNELMDYVRWALGKAGLMNLI